MTESEDRAPSRAAGVVRWVPVGLMAAVCLAAVFELQRGPDPQLARWVEDWVIYEILAVLTLWWAGPAAAFGRVARVLVWVTTLALGMTALVMARAATWEVIAPFGLFMAVRLPTQWFGLSTFRAQALGVSAMFVRLPMLAAAGVAGGIFVGLIGGPPAVGVELSREAVTDLHVRMAMTAAAMFYFPAVEWAEERVVRFLRSIDRGT